MDVVFARCAGIEVHQRLVVVGRLTVDATGQRLAQTRTFGTTTSAWRHLSDWLAEGGCTHVGLQSTGDEWKPISNLLEGTDAVWLLNAQPSKAVPGRKTAVKDAPWIAERLAQGLVRPSFMPPRAQRDLRDLRALTRERISFVRERAPVVKRVQKLLEGANRQLCSVLTDVMGVSGRAILTALLAGATDPATLAERACGQLRPQARAAGARPARAVAAPPELRAGRTAHPDRDRG